MHGVGRHTQVSQIARGCIVQALPHKHRCLVDDSLVHWQPVQANKNRRDVVVAMSPGDQAGCRVLHRLESPKINISDPDQKRVGLCHLLARVLKCPRSIMQTSRIFLVDCYSH